MTLLPEFQILARVISLVHFKRTQLTSAALWTINNFLNQSQQCLDQGTKTLMLQTLIDNGIGRALKVVHECYRFARDKKLSSNTSSKSKTLSIFSPVQQDVSDLAIDKDSHLKELFWCYNYLTSLGAQFTEALLSQHEHLITFIVEDVAKESELDISPSLMALCSMLDQTSQDSSVSETCPRLAQGIYAFITNPATYQTLIERAFATQTSEDKKRHYGKHCLYLLSNSIALVHSMQDV